MLTRFLVCLLILAGLLFVVFPASADLIQNGDFESGTANWSILNVDGSGGLAAGNPGNGFVLNSSGGADDPTIYQTANGLAAGMNFQISGDFRLYHLTGGTNIKAFSVAIDNVYLADFDVPNSWGRFEYTFTATNTSHTFYFMGERYGSDYSTEVDNISLTRIVPEPSSLVSLFGGLAALGGMIVRRKR